MPPRTRWIAAALIAVAAPPASPQDIRSFEAASVRASSAATRTSRTQGGPGSSGPGQITYTNVPLEDVILTAYDLRRYQLKAGPSWLDSERFDILAKVPAGASKQDLRAMLQDLLAVRFHLAAHRETQEGPTFDLVVDKNGPKLKAAGEAPEHGTLEMDSTRNLVVAPNALGRPVSLAGKNLVTMISGGRIIILANSQPVSALTDALARLMDGPVRDSTGLAGLYDFTLDFAPPNGTRLPSLSPPGELLPGAANDEPPLTVFQALKERLGLRFDSRRGPIDVLVIDRVDRVPTAN